MSAGTQSSEAAPRVTDAAGLGQGPGVCMSNMFPGVLTHPAGDHVEGL